MVLSFPILAIRIRPAWKIISANETFKDNDVPDADADSVRALVGRAPAAVAE